MSFNRILAELEVYCGTKLSKATSEAFSFLCENSKSCWDNTRIVTFSYRLLPMSREEKDNDDFSSADRAKLVEFLTDLMKNFPAIIRATTPPILWIPTDAEFISTYDQYDWQTFDPTNDSFYHPELYLIYAWYTENTIYENRACELMREHRNKLNMFFIREDGFDHTLLSFACFKGMTQFVKLLLENGASPQHINNEKCLVFADRYQYIPNPTLVKLLVENGAKVVKDACIQEKLSSIDPNLCIEIEQLII